MPGRVRSMEPPIRGRNVRSLAKAVVWRSDRRALSRLYLAGGECGALVDHAPVVRVRVVRGKVQPVRADRIFGSADLDRLRLIERADGDRRLTEEVHGPNVRRAEEDHRS